MSDKPSTLGDRICSDGPDPLITVTPRDEPQSLPPPLPESKKEPMSTPFPQIVSARRNGSEPFRLRGRPAEFKVLDYWQWSMSDLVSNASRGRLAEFIVARALDAPTDGVRDEWAAFDLTTKEGIKVEVKSSAYLQSWTQRKPSLITFSVRRARAWDPRTNLLADQPSRPADVYVFALLAHQDKSSLDPLDLDQWQFYVVTTRAINERKRSQHSITLKSLCRMNAGPVSFGDLRAAVLALIPNKQSA